MELQDSLCMRLEIQITAHQNFLHRDTQKVEVDLVRLAETPHDKESVCQGILAKMCNQKVCGKVKVHNWMTLQTDESLSLNVFAQRDRGKKVARKVVVALDVMRYVSVGK